MGTHCERKVEKKQNVFDRGRAKTHFDAVLCD